MYACPFIYTSFLFNLETFFYAEYRTLELPVKGIVEYLIENHQHNLSKAVASYFFQQFNIEKCLTYILFSRGTHERFIMKLLQITLLLAFYTGLGPAFTDKVVTSLPSYLVLLYIVLVICLLIGGEPTVNFGSQCNLQISCLSVSRLVTNLYMYMQVLRAMLFLQEQCQTAFNHAMLCLSLFS